MDKAVLQQVIGYRQRMASALDTENFEELKECSAACEVFLRHNLPTYPASAENIAQMISELEQLVVLYRKAVTIVESARLQTQEHLSKLNRNRSNTSKYLDVAGNFPA